MSRILGAVAVAGLLSLLMGYCVLTLVGWTKDNLGGPYMGLVGVLSLVLGVGLAGFLTRRPRAPDQDDPPRRFGA